MRDVSVIDTGFVRLNQLLLRIIDLAKHEQKEALYKMANTFINDSDDYLALIYKHAGITDKDIAKFAEKENDAVLIQQAAHISPALKRQGVKE